MIKPTKQRGLVRWLLSLEEMAVAVVGMAGLLGLCYLLALTRDRQLVVGLVGSFGASVTLILACPDSRLGRPYAAVVGNGASAVVGVAVWQGASAAIAIGWGDAAVVTGAAVLAVALAVGVMHLLDALHPPGGATALIAVIGGPDVHTLGWWYPLCPITVGTLWLLALARVREWRRPP